MRLLMSMGLLWLLTAGCCLSAFAENSTTPTVSGNEPLTGSTSLSELEDTAVTDVTEPIPTTTTTAWYEADASLEDMEDSERLSDWGGFGFEMAKKYFIASDTSSFLWLDASALVSLMRPFVLTIGMIMAMFAWAVNTKKLNHGPIFERSKLFPLALNMLVAMVGVMLSYWIMHLVLALCSLLSKGIVGASDVAVATRLTAYKAFISDYKSAVPVVGLFVQIANFLRSEWATLLVNIFFAADSVLLGVTLGIRQVKLAMYTATAPAFLGGMGGGESWRTVGRNFIMAYLRTALQLPLMAMAYGLFEIGFVAWCNSPSETTTFTAVLLLAILGFSIVRCDRWFEKILN